MTVLLRHSYLLNIKVLLSVIPTQGSHFSIWKQNMEFRQGGRKWMVHGCCLCADDEDDNEVFLLEIACELIRETEQRGGMQVVHLNNVE